jgi:hypothetical protein
MQRWYVAQPRPQKRFCQLTAGRLLALSEVDFPPRLLYNMKAACSEVDFEDLNSTVCTIRGVEVGSTARWLAQFTPLTSELQQVLDAMRLQLPSRVRTAYGPSRCSTGSHLTHTHTHTHACTLTLTYIPRARPPSGVPTYHLPWHQRTAELVPSP